MTTQAGTAEPTAVPAGTTVLLVSSGGPPVTGAAAAAVPDVVGSKQVDALAALQQLGLNTQSYTQASGAHPRGTVVAQWPKAGEFAAYGSGAAILVSSGPAAKDVPLLGVPSVIGQTELGAETVLQQAGLQSAVLHVASPTVPAGIVLGQLPEDRTLVPPRRSRTLLWVIAIVVVLAAAAAVALYVSRGTSSGATVAVPQLVGLTRAKAEAALTDAGLKTGKVTESSSSAAKAGTVTDQDPAKDTKVNEGSAVDLVVATPEQVAVPDVTGTSQESATQTLGRAQLQVAVTEASSDKVPAGTVISQDPSAGAKVTVDTKVRIVVSTGPKQVNVKVPDVVGQTSSAAIQQLATVNLTATPVDTYSPTVPTGKVVAQAPAAGTSVASGTPVALLVSLGPDPSATTTVKVPDVVGSSLDAASKTLTDAGFEVTSLKADGSGKPADEVLYQAPAADESVPTGSEVVLIVSSGN
jgi:beta-lactam-binding protein with PASTA domain